MPKPGLIDKSNQGLININAAGTQGLMDLVQPHSMKLLHLIPACSGPLPCREANDCARFMLEFSMLRLIMIMQAHEARWTW